MKPLISLHDLAVGYGAKPVLEGLRVEIAQGSFTALLGTNGSGKTTLLKTIVGILPPLAGRVEFHDANGRAPVLGYVPQRETLDPIYLLSSAEVVLMGTYGRLGAGRLFGLEPASQFVRLASGLLLGRPSSGRISRPCRASSSSRMISGRNNDTTYEHTENWKPGTISSVTAAPPTTCRRSSTSTLRPARARYAAATSPLWPAPITMASYLVDTMPTL